MMSKTLNDLLSTLPNPSEFPLPLPLAHLTVARWFKSIISDGELQPRMCSVFNEEITYLFYGGVFYRPNSPLTQNASECPVAFVFSPNILSYIFRLFPFDTGALASGRFGSWSGKLKPFEKFEVKGTGDFKTASKMIHYIFGENSQYLKGEADCACSGYPEPLPELYNFYAEDLTSLGTDQRQCIIECHGNVKIPFKDNLLWVGFPESMTGEIAKLYEWMEPNVPDFYPYPVHKIINPAETAAKLEEIARNQVIGKYVSRLK